MSITYPKSHLTSEQFSGEDYVKWLRSLTPEQRLQYEIRKNITSNRVGGGIHGIINARGIMELSHYLIINYLYSELGRVQTDDTVEYTYKKYLTKRKRGVVKFISNRLAKKR